MGWHMARSIAGTSSTYADTLHRGKVVEMESMQGLLSIPSYVSIKILILPVFKRGCTDNNSIQYNISLSDMLSLMGNTAHTSSSNITLGPGLF